MPKINNYPPFIIPFVNDTRATTKAPVKSAILIDYNQFNYLIIKYLFPDAEKIAASTARGNAADDIKSASGEIYVELKRILNMTKCGNTKDAFFRDTLAPLITEDTSIYKELEREIFS